jgi:hypothetical protein
MNCNISWTRSFVMNCHHLCEIQRKKMQNGGMVSIWSVPQCLWQILSPSYSPLMNPFLHSTFSCLPDGNTHCCDCFDFGSRSAGLHFHVSCFSRRNEEAFFSHFDHDGIRRKLRSAFSGIFGADVIRDSENGMCFADFVFMCFYHVLHVFLTILCFPCMRA